MHRSKAVFLLLLLMGVVIGTWADKECAASLRECKYTFNIERHLSMTWRGKNVIASNGKLYEQIDPTKEVPADEVIIMDGVRRSVIAVNGKIPGPPIIVRVGQEVVVKVNNKLLAETVAIHWHGYPMKGQPYMDGSTGITQCPIVPGQSFVYRFKVQFPGTYIYHAHVKGVRIEGLFGAFIVKPAATVQQAVEEKIMMFGDWYHQRPEEIALTLRGDMPFQKGFDWPMSPDGLHMVPLKFVSSHINGRGRYYDAKTGFWTESPYTKYSVTTGSSYRFRIIAVGNEYPMRVSVDNHHLQVVAMDGFDVKPRTFESIIVQPGERYDVILTADQNPNKNYWVRTVAIEKNAAQGKYTLAILQYGSSSSSEPTTTTTVCSNQVQPCEVLNCPWPFFGEDERITCVGVDQMVREDGTPDTPLLDMGDKTDDYFLNFHLILDTRAGMIMGVNGHVFQIGQFYNTPEEKEFIATTSSTSCDREECINNPSFPCHCTNQVTLPYDKTIQMVFTNHPPTGMPFVHHPVHLHGHHFHVMKIGYGTYNAKFGNWTGFTPDLKCVDKSCQTTKWTDQSHKGNSVPGLKLSTAPLKDTVIVPAGGYAVIRFRTDNPGRWLVHCHIETHVIGGMSFLLNEAPEKQQKPPRGFPKCHDFLNNPEKDMIFALKGEDHGEKEVVSRESYIALITLIVIFAVFLIIMVGIIAYLSKRKTAVNTEKKEEEK